MLGNDLVMIVARIDGVMTDIRSPSGPKTSRRACRQALDHRGHLLLTFKSREAPHRSDSNDSRSKSCPPPRSAQRLLHEARPFLKPETPCPVGMCEHSQ